MTRSEFVARSTSEIYAAQFRQIPGSELFSVTRAREQAELLADEHEKLYGPMEFSPPCSWGRAEERMRTDARLAISLREENRLLDSTVADLNNRVKMLESLRDRTKEESVDKLLVECERARTEAENLRTRINELEKHQ